jgi:hypothetical protein
LLLTSNRGISPAGKNIMWKDIAGYIGQYKINENGEVLSLKSSKILKPWISGNGYYKVELSGKRFRLSIIVAETFITKPDKKCEVNHRDGNKLNNSVGNLEWVSHSDNMKHAFNNFLIDKKKNATAKRNPNKYRHTSFVKEKNKWRSFVKIDGVQKHLGYASTEIEAHKLYLKYYRKITVD